MDKPNEHLQKTEYSDLLEELTREADAAVEEFSLNGETSDAPKEKRSRKAPSRLSKDAPSGWESVTGRLPFLKKETGKLPVLPTEDAPAEEAPAADAPPADGPAPAVETAAADTAQTAEPVSPAAAPPAEKERANAPQKERVSLRSRLSGLSPAALWELFWTELKQECADFRAAVSRFLLRWSESFRQSNVNFHEVVAAKRNHDFPESSHFLLQLLLFLWGMLPCIVNRMAERVLHRRSKKLRRSERIARITERMHMHPGWFLGGAGALAAVVIFFSLYTFASEVSFRGESLGSVGDADSALVALRRVEMATKEAVNEQYTLDDSNISTSTSLVRRSELLSEDDLENLISEKVGLVTRGYGLHINGELICSTEYEYVLEDLLEQLKYAYTTGSTVSSDFEEDVQITYGYVPTSTLRRIGEIAEILNSSHEEEVIYRVKSGDVWSRIANDNGMTSAELLKLNPGYNPALLHVGDELVLSAAVPYLTTTFTEQQHYVADVPYEVEYQDDPSMYKGDTKVLSAGVYGKADVMADVTYKNGEEITRVIRSYTQLTEPVTELQARGTKERPTWHATGRFRWPCTGTITSRYGGRNLWGSYNNHGGIDIANKKGTAIYAADGGTVTYAGWQGTYGYLVIINHGNGYETYYAHNSSLLVKKGDKVHKGEQIARMGSTGRASGSHCHFEVRYNGSRRNPMNYL